jgi:pSer/pThr/pTyr-binding forkhead associated (FHA) protein
VISATSEWYDTGTAPGAGTFSCLDCNAHVSLRELDELPDCPRCGKSRFRRASMFDPLPTDDFDGTATGVGMDGTPEPSTERTMEFEAPARAPERTEWVAEVRSSLTEPGRYLAWDDDGLHVHRLAKGWNRIGRSATADLRLDDPTVSRRHALLVWEPGERLRVLDDRSLNGIFLNDELVEWASISDGDELAIGRYRLVLIES